jgi:glycosyltransferase involved in cell wall biosynthesis
VSIANRAAKILTNSNYTKTYLTAAGFVTDDTLGKVVVAPLPLLGRKRAVDISDREQRQLHQLIRARPFLFYPTANRPNKSITFFVWLLAHLRLKSPEICAVLTCSLDSVPGVRKAASDYGVLDSLIFLPGSSEGVVKWLYQHCIALCLTSVAEGNFPPQVLEALNYGAPVVATRLPTITEIPGCDVNDLLLCDPLNLAEFADAIEVATEQRENVLQRQQKFLADLDRWNSSQAFRAQLAIAMPSVAFFEGGDQRSGL